MHSESKVKLNDPPVGIFGRIVLLFTHNGPINQLNACLRQHFERICALFVVVDFQSGPN